MLAVAAKELPAAEQTRTMFVIPQANYAKFEADIEKLSEKSKKAGGWEITPLIIGYKIDTKTNRKSYEVYLDAPDVQIEGWRFVATLDHSQETGNIVRTMPNTTIPAIYRSVQPNCDHCNIRRIRRDTFVIQSVETGEFKQVGSTCLQGFFQTDPRATARMAELFCYANERAEAAQREPVSRGTMTLRDDRCIDMVNYLENTAAIIRQYGWVSGKVAFEQGRTSTATLAYTNMQINDSGVSISTRDVPVEDEDRAVVAKALAWARALRNKPEMNDYENNVSVVAYSQFIEGRAAGIAASIVGVYIQQEKRNRPVAGPIQLGDMSAVIALLNTAGSRLKNPKITIDLPDAGVVVLTLAKAHHKVPGSINIKTAGGYDNSDWYGRILANGQYQPSRIAPKGLEAGLMAFAADPAGVAAAHGFKSGNCCFCSLPLTDARSVKNGFGKTCAGNYGLPYVK